MERDIDLTLDAPSRASLVRVAGTHEKTIAAMEVEVESRNKGNFNAPMRNDASVSFAYDSDGLLRESRIDRFPRAAQISSQMSACGLFVGSRETKGDSRASGGGTTAAVVGGVAVPVQTAGMFLQYRFALATASPEPGLCSPQPNVPIQAKATARAQKKMIGSLVSFNRFYELAVHMSCNPGAERRPASDIHSSLSGTYLKVACKTEGATGYLAESGEYAFLSDYGIYLPLVIRPSDAQVDTYNYRSVSFK